MHISHGLPQAAQLRIFCEKGDQLGNHQQREPFMDTLHRDREREAGGKAQDQASYEPVTSWSWGKHSIDVLPSLPEFIWIKFSIYKKRPS